MNAAILPSHIIGADPAEKTFLLAVEALTVEDL